MTVALWLGGGAAVYAISVLLRLWPRRGLRHCGVDSWFHLHSARIIRRTRRLPEVVPEYILGGQWDYPPLFPALLALIPERALLRVERFVSPLVDSVLPAAAFAMAGFLTHSIWIAMAAGCVAALNPLSVTQTITLTPRPLGALLLSVAVVAAIAYRNTGEMLWLFVAVTMSALVFLAHRMSAQTLVFLFVGLAIALASPVLLLPPLAGMALAWAGSGGFYRRVLAGHLGELAYWRAHIHERDDAQPLKPIGIASRVEPRRRHGGPTTQVLRQLRLPFVLSPLLLPALLSPLAVRTPQWAPFAREMWTWCVIGLGLCLAVTLIPQLRFIGHGFRYLSYTVLPASVLFALALTHEELRYLFVGLCLPALVMVLWVVPTHRPDPTAEAELLADLESAGRRLRQCPGARVLCIPSALASPVAYLAEVPVLRHGGQAGLMRFSFFVPVVKRPLSEIAETYRLSHVVCDTRIASAEDLGLPGWRTLLSGGRLQLAELMKEETNLQAGIMPVAVGEDRGT